MLVYVSEHVKSQRRMDLEDGALEAVWVEVHTKGAKVCSVYHPLNARVGWITDFSVMMEAAASEKRDRAVMGDFNCNVMNPDYRACELTQVAAEYGLKQLIISPTELLKIQ